MIFTLCSLVSGAWAAEKDWLDEMPTVPAVVQAVRGDDCTSQFGDDEDRLAAEIVGTLTLLRWIMLFQALEEGGATPPRFPTAKWVTEQASAGLEKMAKPRSAKLQLLEAMYMQAELVIGRGTGKRRGFLTTLRKCDTNNSFSMRVGNRNVGCYPYWFHNYLGNTYSSMEHRRQILPKLFAKDLAQNYLDLVTRYVLAAPEPYEPSLTLAMPTGSGYPIPGPDYCKPYGGDSNGSGLCDGWECRSSGTVQASITACGEVTKASNPRIKKTSRFGPFATIKEAAIAAEPEARLLTNDSAESSKIPGFGGRESCLLILIDNRYGIYYFTPPIVSIADGRKCDHNDFNNSLNLLFANSSEDRSNFSIIASAHTHPGGVGDVPDLFSGADFNHAIIEKRKWPGFRMFLFNPDSGIDCFEALPTDKEMLILLPFMEFTNTLFFDYQRRVISIRPSLRK